jgi:cytochrome c oxidase subunit 1/cytochrome c oxidase subunit I+III
MVLDKGKEALATTFLDAAPDAILKMPEDSTAPFVVTLAMSAFFVGLLLQMWWLAAVGGLAMLAGALVWLWPERELAQRAEAHP